MSAFDFFWFSCSLKSFLVMNFVALCGLPPVHGLNGSVRTISPISTRTTRGSWRSVPHVPLEWRQLQWRKTNTRVQSFSISPISPHLLLCPPVESDRLTAALQFTLRLLLSASSGFKLELFFFLLHSYYFNFDYVLTTHLKKYISNLYLSRQNHWCWNLIHKWEQN